MAYNKGTLIRCRGEFIDADAGVDVDPATVTFKAKAPSGALTTYTTPAAQIVKDSVGHYHVDLTASESGAWSYRFEGSGTNQSTAESTFNVKPSVF